MKFHTVERLGPKQSVTPEGFLLCEDVPIARTGVMLYGPNEVPVSVGPDNFIRIRRDEEHVFAEAHIASYAGKDIVNDHPGEDVTPANWSSLSMGTVLNPRRGSGILADFLIADLLVKSPEAIKEIRENGKVEVSCGYNADYLEVEPGHGRQVNMIGNHVALVSAGRCGPSCAIRDQESPTLGGTEMRFKDESITSRLAATIRKAFADKDEKALTGALLEVEAIPVKTKDEGIAIHLHAAGSSGTQVTTGGPSNADESAAAEEEEKKKATDRGMSDAERSDYEGFKKSMQDGMKAMMDAITALTPKAADAAADPDIEEEKPAGTSDSVMKAKDSALLSDAFQQVASGAEILVPGIFVPNFDEAAEPKKTYDSLTGLRREALRFFAASPAGAGLLPALYGKEVDIAKLTTKDARTLFNSAVAVQKERNNNARSTDAVLAAVAAKPAQGAQRTGRISSIAELNERNRKFYTPEATPSA